MFGASIAPDSTLFQVRAVNSRNRESPETGSDPGKSVDGRRSVPPPYEEEPSTLTGYSWQASTAFGRRPR